MPGIYLRKAVHSHYCKAVFLVALTGSYFLIPSHVFAGRYAGVAVLFMFTFSLLLTCFVYQVKEKVKNKRKQGVSFLGILASVLGLAAVQFCGVGAPVCGAGLGMVFLSSILPSFFVGALSQYSNLILVVAIGVQVLTLLHLGCFKRVANIN